MDLVKEIYLITKSFPKQEVYGLTSQIKRAAVSVPTNIAEGIGRNYRRDSIQFFHISRGSLYELETLLIIAVTTEALEKESFNEISSKMDKCLQVVNGLIKYFEKADLK